jgi:low affinity Fe/Cu permease
MPTKPTKRKSSKKKTPDLSEQVTSWIGTPASLVVHTIFFLLCFFLVFIGIEADRVMLILTTIVSLEAIYLAIFIQMTVNRSVQSLKEVEENIDEIQEDVEELAEDIGEIQEDVEELAEELEEEHGGGEKKKINPLVKALEVIPVPFGPQRTKRGNKEK